MLVRRILYIDDDPQEVDGFEDELTDKGYEVTHYCWPHEAGDSEKANSYTLLPDFGKYDLILLDVIMGSGDLGRIETEQGFITGLVFHQKKIAPKYSHLPVFLISALPESSHKTKAMAYAKKLGLAYITKSSETVNEILRHILLLDAKQGA